MSWITLHKIKRQIPDASKRIVNYRGVIIDLDNIQFKYQMRRVKYKMTEYVDHQLFFGLPSNRPTKTVLYPLCEVRKNPADVIWRKDEFLFLDRAELREMVEFGGMTLNKVSLYLIN